MAALQERALARIEETGVVIPPLCNCNPGTSVFEAQWETCANNCEFRGNPKAYIKALTELFQSMGIE